ncbi:uncharacterized protein [Bemisia tabaci]|nr:PREDICTED: uncharacterized protein LOC109043333 isoform X2 [Bemisia tabaci]
MRVDHHTVKGNSTLLECKFDLEGSRLYTVKWYKDGHEFYRFLPKDKPQVLTFPVPGVHVDTGNSSASQVLLTDLDLSSTGRYRCEVSGEAPAFETVTDHGDMITVALPTEGPKIFGGRPRYQIGDTVRLNCTSERSKPAAQLHWFINGAPVDNAYLRGPYTRFIGSEELEETTLGLQFKVEPHHFKRDDMKLKCLATIATVYWKSNEKSVEGEKQSRPPTLESKKTGAHTIDHGKSRADRVQANRGCCGRTPLCLIQLACLAVLLPAQFTFLPFFSIR